MVSIYFKKEPWWFQMLHSKERFWKICFQWTRILWSSMQWVWTVDLTVQMLLRILS